MSSFNYGIWSHLLLYHVMSSGLLRGGWKWSSRTMSRPNGTYITIVVYVHRCVSACVYVCVYVHVCMFVPLVLHFIWSVTLILIFPPIFFFLAYRCRVILLNSFCFWLTYAFFLSLFVFLSLSVCPCACVNQVNEGLHPNVITYAAAIAACKNRYEHHHHVYVYVYVLSVCIRACCLRAYADTHSCALVSVRPRVKSSFYHMSLDPSNHSLLPTIYLYRVSCVCCMCVVRVCCMFRPQTVIALLQRMKKENVIPNTIVLTAAIDSLAREGGGTHTGRVCVSHPLCCTSLCRIVLYNLTILIKELSACPAQSYPALSCSIISPIPSPCLVVHGTAKNSTHCLYS